MVTAALAVTGAISCHVTAAGRVPKDPLPRKNRREAPRAST